MKLKLGYLYCLLCIIFFVSTQAIVLEKHSSFTKISGPQQGRVSSYPFISGDTFRAFCDFVIDETDMPFDSEMVQNGDIIFVKTDFLEYFFTVVRPHIDKKYILITHNSAKSVPDTFAKYLNDEQLIAWFGQNASIDYPKMIPIPLGIANARWPHGNITTLRSVIDNLPMKKNKLLYLNISVATHPERKVVERLFSNKSFCLKSDRKPFKQYLEDLASSHFVLSPRGTGIDCVRTWESLLCGSFPIIKHSNIDELFADLPVVIINDWQEITEQFLRNKLDEFSKKKDFKMERIYADYWFDLIRQIQQQYRE